MTPARGRGRPPKNPKPTTSVNNETDSSQKDEKTSTVNNSDSKTRQSNDNGDGESLTSLDMMENDDLEEEEVGENGVKKSNVRLSAILPKPNNSKSSSTPASSSKRG